MTGATPTPFSLTLDFYPNPDHAGIYMAEKLGYFADAGLDVSIQTPSDPAAPTKLVAAGQTDLAISYEPEVMLAHEKGLDVVAVGALVDRPADLDDLAGEIRDQGDRRPAGEDDRDRRDPLPGRLPEDDPRPRQPLARRREDGQRRLRPAAGDPRRQGRRDAGRLQQRRGRRPAAARARTRSSPPSTGSASPPTTSSSWSPTASASKKTPSPTASSSPRSPAAPRPPSRAPARPSTRCSRPTPTSTRS